MKPSTLLGVIVGLASVAIATPVPEPAPAPAPENATLETRDGNWAYCQFDYLGDDVSIYLKAGGPFVTSGQNPELEGYINDQCGEDHFQGWSYWGSGPYYFNYLLTAGFPDKCTENAIWLATQSTGAYYGLECQYSNNPGSF